MANFDFEIARFSKNVQTRT